MIGHLKVRSKLLSTGTNGHYTAFNTLDYFRLKLQSFDAFVLVELIVIHLFLGF